MKNSVNFALTLVFPVLFNVLFFSIFGTQHNSTVWTAYLFTHFAYFALATTPIWSDSKGQVGERGYSLYYVSGLYFLIVLAISCLFIVMSRDAPKFCCTLLTAVTLVYAFFFLSFVSANRHTLAQEERRTQEARFIDGARVKVLALVDALDEPSGKESAKEILRLIESSPLRSNDEVERYEYEILIELDEALSLVSVETNYNFEDNERSIVIMEKLRKIERQIKMRNRILTIS